MDQSVNRAVNKAVNKAIADLATYGKNAAGIVARVNSVNMESPASNTFIEVFTQSQNVSSSQARRSNLGRSVQRTGIIPSDKNVKWSHNFFYNTNELVDDNLTFVLKTQDSSQLGRATIRNLALLVENVSVDASSKRQELALLNNGNKKVATLSLEISRYHKYDLIGGVEMPNLSLMPPNGFKGQYSAVDLYNTDFKDKKNLATRANCFSFMDGCISGGLIPGFDDLDVVSSKYQHLAKINAQK